MKKIIGWKLIGWDEDGNMANLGNKISNWLAQQIDDWITELESEEE